MGRKEWRGREDEGAEEEDIRARRLDGREGEDTSANLVGCSSSTSPASSVPSLAQARAPPVYPHFPRQRAQPLAQPYHLLRELDMSNRAAGFQKDDQPHPCSL